MNNNKTRTVVCFHKPNEINGWLSNWALYSFEIDGVKFSSVEQYMMYAKAVTFKDVETAKKILRTEDPKIIKELGRQVKNYDDAVWSKVRYDVVFDGVHAKLRFNPELVEKLRKFKKDSLFAECAVNDRVWGIGLSMKDPDRLDPSKWRGTNYLGKIWEDMRYTFDTENN